MKKWSEKLHKDRLVEVKKINKRFADIPEGSKMLIASPKIIDNYIRHIPEGKESTLKIMRNDLAITHQAEYTCPVTTGIFLRIVSEAAYEQYEDGVEVTEIAPFWRMINEKMPIAKKLSFGTSFLNEQRIKEGLV